MSIYIKVKRIFVTGAFIMGFLYGVVMFYQEACSESMSLPLFMHYLLYGFMGGLLFAGIIWVSVSMCMKVMGSAKGRSILLYFRQADKKKKSFIVIIVIIIIAGNMALFFDNIQPVWEGTLESAYEKAVDSSEPSFSQLQIILQKEYRNSCVIIAYDNDNLCLYNFKIKYKNGKKEYSFSNEFKRPILDECTKEDIEFYSFVPNLTGNCRMSFGATYSDISTLKINGKKPDYVIEEEINRKKVNIWFFEYLGDDFTIQSAQIEI